MRATASLRLLTTLALLLPQCAAAERAATAAGAVEVERMVDGLDTPWAIGFLPDDGLVITERGGRLLLVDAGGKRPVAGVPEVRAKGQGGLLDVVVARDHAATGTVFLTYAEPRDGGAATAVAVARLDRAAARLEDVQVIFRQDGPREQDHHFGSRVVEAPDGTLFVTLGERGQRHQAQDLGTHKGKVVRIARDGSVPVDNPFVGQAGALPEIWSYGHRNPQGAALGLDGALWTVEHGPRGGDEVNLTEAGRNYGWPVITYGEEYAGGSIGVGSAAEGMEQPLHQWTPSIAPSGLVVYSGRLWPEWRGHLFVGALQYDAVVRLTGDAGGVVEAERLLEGVHPRIRDVREAPDGSIWFLSETEGAAYRITPAP